MNEHDATPSAFRQEMERTIAALKAERDRKRERLASAQQAFDTVEQKVSTLESALTIWLELHPEERPTPAVDTALRDRFRKLSTREMLIALARASHGQITGSEAAQTLTAAQIFPDIRTASANVYAAFSRSTDVFERVSRGRYRVIENQDGATLSQVESVRTMASLTTEDLIDINTTKFGGASKNVPPADRYSASEPTPLPFGPSAASGSR